jgi:hypothetical protein
LIEDAHSSLADAGIIFGNYLAAALRNPSAAQGQFGNLIFGPGRQSTVVHLPERIAPLQAAPLTDFTMFPRRKGSLFSRNAKCRS